MVVLGVEKDEFGVGFVVFIYGGAWGGSDSGRGEVGRDYDLGIRWHNAGGGRWRSAYPLGSVPVHSRRSCGRHLLRCSLIVTVLGVHDGVIRWFGLRSVTKTVD